MPTFHTWKVSAVAALLILLVFQAAGWFLAWAVLVFEAHNKAQMALQRREAPLEQVTISIKLFSEIRIGKKEIRLEGRLYDIKSREIAGDSIQLHLYHDRHEEALLAALGDLVAPRVSAGNNRHLPLQQWLANWLGSPFLVLAVQVLCEPPAAVFQPVFAFLLPFPQYMPTCLAPPPKG
ncbi:MAG: hypothetical protein IPJ82_25405 [Lewinellaceae bacterium]|nr:hypothetical protein [Lewinellaceae bacterium]